MFSHFFGQKHRSSPTIHAISMNTGSISMRLKEYTRVIIRQVLSQYVTHLLCLDGVNLCLFSVNFCQSILKLDVDYVLFTKQNALEISSCGRDQFSGDKQNKSFTNCIRDKWRRLPKYNHNTSATDSIVTTFCNCLELQLLISAQTVSFFFSISH